MNRTTCPYGMVDTCCENYNDCSLDAEIKRQKWVGLTDKEHDSIKHNYHNMTWTLEMFAKAIEQALKEKNQ